MRLIKLIFRPGRHILMRLVLQVDRLLRHALFLALFKLVQTLRLRCQHRDLLLNIGVCLHEAVEHDREIIVEFD